MSDAVQDPNASGAAEQSEKGKGRAVDQHPGQQSEDDEEEDDEEEEGEGEPEEADEDNMEEIDTDNIIGSRTRGKNIDYAEAAKQLEGADDEDDEDDEDFQDEEMSED